VNGEGEAAGEAGGGREVALGGDPGLQGMRDRGPCVAEVEDLRRVETCVPSPRIVFRESRQEYQIAEFLEWRNEIKKIKRQSSQNHFMRNDIW